MSDKQKIFLSFAVEDRLLAERLQADLSERGAEVFQFLRSAVPGTEAWSQVLESIERADWFIVLLTESAIESKPVRYEIRQAQHRYINEDKPRLIPALVEQVEKPSELRIFTNLPFDDYAAALLRLSAMLKLSPGATTQEDSRVHALELRKTEARTVPSGTWVDPATHLMWTLKDNGEDINWTQASEYAKKLRLGGYDDWRLPTVEELEGLYDERVGYDPRGDKVLVHIKKQLKLTGHRVWSSGSEGSGSAQALFFANDRVYSAPVDRSNNLRALCVRVHSVSTDRILLVRVHRAFFEGQPEEFYFVNLTNFSQRPIEVTHVWYEDEEEHHISVVQEKRWLPRRLDTDESWETWMSVDSIPDRHRDNAYDCFRARISIGEVFSSRKNPDVPRTGSVPGGPL